MIMFLYLLDKKLGGLPWGEWSLPFLGLACGSSLTAFVSLATLQGCQRVLGTEGLVIQLVQLGVASFAGLGVFALFVNQMKLPEVEMFVDRIRGRFGK
jgi:putative peptidoglycan lipid II flippase